MYSASNVGADTPRLLVLSNPDLPDNSVCSIQFQSVNAGLEMGTVAQP